MFRPETWYPDNNVEIRLSTEVTAIDRAEKTVTLSDGATLRYGILALATGATPRRLPAGIGGDLDGVFTVRDYRDADRLGLEMQEGRRALVVGKRQVGDRQRHDAAVGRHAVGHGPRHVVTHAAVQVGPLRSAAAGGAL